MGFRFDKPDRIRFFSSMFCGMASDKADNPINLHRKGRMTSPGQALLFFRSAASAVRPDIAGRRVCLDRPRQSGPATGLAPRRNIRSHCPVSIVNFAIIPISSAKILFFPPVRSAMSVPRANGCHTDADDRHSGTAPSSAVRVVLNSQQNYLITMRICHRRTI